jgi:hypothetical protein
MGRLTLNVLLSFAQFEREVTSERIRDKIAASKRKGLWVGGMAPLGYDTNDRKITQFTAQLESCTVAIEACCGAHHLGRQLIAQRHVVRLMSPAYVRPYVKAQKNDERDAEAIAEAATRPTMRYVEVKSEERTGARAVILLVAGGRLLLWTAPSPKPRRRARGHPQPSRCR